jgi:hypothetical protein
MPFTTEELSAAGAYSLNYQLRNKPIDQIGIEHPLLKALMAKQKPFPGGKQYIVENLKFDYGSNFQWYYGDQIVTYNKRRTVTTAQFAWASAHDGFTLNEDELLQNGIEIDDRPGAKPGRHADFEKDKLVDLFDDRTYDLRMGFEQQLDRALHLTASGESINGLSALIAITPSSGTVGGINRATSGNEWWRNHSSTLVAQGSLINTMETMWRNCVRNGGKPDLIICGSDFLDDFRAAADAVIDRYTILPTAGGSAGFDPGVTNLSFKGVPIIWSPTFKDLDSVESVSPVWEKRCYMINTNHLRLRPMRGHDMVSRTPPRVYDRYAYYWGLTWKGALTMNRGNAHGVLGLD